MEIKKILWPTDLSRSCQSVMPYLSRMRELDGAELLVLYVIPDLGDVGDWYGEATPEHVAKYEDWERARAQQKLEEVCTGDLGPGLKVTHKVAVGDPYAEIMKNIEQEDVDLVVLASRGRGAEKRATFDFGGIADKVVKNSSVPVLVVNPGVGGA